ncbi:cytidine deaminase [Desulfitispora alkaliphila]|uniref:cytidine deaminase n=1 Tax=Desulfitispora alkaliphila TaxID=622674 RepID=UPI003D231061
MTITTYRELLERAIEAKKNAYAPYSKFPVGAALLTTDNSIFTGCNVENASYGLTNCAERTAVYTAVAAGYSNFKAIAIVTNLEELATPCGACRQVLIEFGSEIDIIVGNEKGEYQVYTSGELLPSCFSGEQLGNL